MKLYSIFYDPAKPQKKIAQQVDYLNSWWPGAESNHRHKDFQSSALPTELPGQDLRLYRITRPYIC